MCTNIAKRFRKGHSCRLWRSLLCKKKCTPLARLRRPFFSYRLTYMLHHPPPPPFSVPLTPPSSPCFAIPLLPPSPHYDAPPLPSFAIALIVPALILATILALWCACCLGALVIDTVEYYQRSDVSVAPANGMETASIAVGVLVAPITVVADPLDISRLQS